ncbi:stress-associated endoplasmic reticulum protein 1 [Calypte anna]|uniref:stress-associated endoplasmic reticulum protein 1 n=1 Tax=Calypte anna TaxID=9244 RepID=UPI0011C3DBC6|nr:stress-associated endoplasmic reticulum protein 1 [Calypte anna]
MVAKQRIRMANEKHSKNISAAPGTSPRPRGRPPEGEGVRSGPAVGPLFIFAGLRISHLPDHPGASGWACEGPRPPPALPWTVPPAGARQPRFLLAAAAAERCRHRPRRHSSPVTISESFRIF